MCIRDRDFGEAEKSHGGGAPGGRQSSEFTQKRAASRRLSSLAVPWQRIIDGSIESITRRALMSQDLKYHLAELMRAALRSVAQMCIRDSLKRFGYPL